MSTLIIGSGIAGLTTAIRSKENGVHDIRVLEKPVQSSNTRISGLRFREDGILEGLKRNNFGELTDEMQKFCAETPEVINHWLQILPFERRPEWFGPHILQGQGGKLLQELRNHALVLGVEFLNGTAKELTVNKGQIKGVRAGVLQNLEHDKQNVFIEADNYVGSRPSSCIMYTYEGSTIQQNQQLQS